MEKSTAGLPPILQDDQILQTGLFMDGCEHYSKATTNPSGLIPGDGKHHSNPATYPAG